MRLLSQDEDRLLHRTSAAGRVGACPIRSNDDNAARQAVNGEEDSTQDTVMGCYGLPAGLQPAGSGWDCRRPLWRDSAAQLQSRPFESTIRYPQCDF